MMMIVSIIIYMYIAACLGEMRLPAVRLRPEVCRGEMPVGGYGQSCTMVRCLVGRLWPELYHCEMPRWAFQVKVVLLWLRLDVYYVCFISSVCCVS